MDSWDGGRGRRGTGGGWREAGPSLLSLLQVVHPPFPGLCSSIAARVPLPWAQLRLWIPSSCLMPLPSATRSSRRPCPTLPTTPASGLPDPAELQLKVPTRRSLQTSKTLQLQPTAVGSHRVCHPESEKAPRLQRLHKRSLLILIRPHCSARWAVAFRQDLLWGRVFPSLGRERYLL